jgi:hypothetical protein
MVLALGVGLSMADEPLLEKLLTDRSKEVRENAARLLSRLPQSAHSLRITGWLQSMLSRNAKGNGRSSRPRRAARTGSATALRCSRPPISRA